MDQAVGLGQEQVEVLEGEKEGAFIGGVASGPEERLGTPANTQTLLQPWQEEAHFNKTARRGYTDRGVISRQNSGILAQVQVEQRIGVVVA